MEPSPLQSKNETVRIDKFVASVQCYFFVIWSIFHPSVLFFGQSVYFLRVDFVHFDLTPRVCRLASEMAAREAACSGTSETGEGEGERGNAAGSNGGGSGKKKSSGRTRRRERRLRNEPQNVSGVI